MLVLKPNTHETIHIGDDITVRQRPRSQRYPAGVVIECGGGVRVVLFERENGGRLRVGIEAPGDVNIKRSIVAGEAGV